MKSAYISLTALKLAVALTGLEAVVEDCHCRGVQESSVTLRGDEYKSSSPISVTPGGTQINDGVGIVFTGYRGIICEVGAWRTY